MTVEEYIKYRTGSIDLLKVIRVIFTKPFKASSLRKFWWYWNPGYGYYLLFYCYRPLRTLLPHSLALILTFLICGFLHDILYLVPIAIMDGGKIPLPFVTTWFLLISIGIIISEYMRINFKNIRTWFRPIIHFGFLALTFAATVYLS
jgi:hypothetical protein